MCLRRSCMKNDTVVTPCNYARHANTIDTLIVVTVHVAACLLKNSLISCGATGDPCGTPQGTKP